MRPVCLCLCLLTCFAQAADWGQFRGPARDGNAPDFVVPNQWPEQLNQLWRLEAGAGLASPVMVDDMVYQFTRSGDKEVLTCYSVADGKRVWQADYDAPFSANAQAANERQFPASRGLGPFATPTVIAGKVLTLGVSKILSCFEAKSGTLLWRTAYFPDVLPSEKVYICPPCNAECDKRTFDQAGICPDCQMRLSLRGTETTTVSVGNYYGAAGSPLVVGDLAVIQVRDKNQGQLIAVNLADGSERWRLAGPIPASSSPVHAVLAGVPQLIVVTRESIDGVDLQGKQLWHHAIQSNAQIVTPIAFEDLVLYAEYKGPLQALRLGATDGRFTVSQAWQANDHPLVISSPILVGETLIGLDSKRRGRLFQVEARTGKTLWEDNGDHGESAALLHTGQTVAALTSAGELLFLAPGDAGLSVVAHYPVANTPTWAHPVMWQNKVLVKDATHLQLFGL